MRRKEMSKAETIMNTIKWINDIFVPRGLSPIEDLPQAVPGAGGSCVIARVLQTNPKWINTNVSTSSVNLRLEYEYEERTGNYEDINAEMRNRLMEESYIDIPEEVRMFIADFDRGDYPEFIDIEDTKEQIEHSEFKTTLMENYYAWAERNEEKI